MFQNICNTRHQAVQDHILFDVTHAAKAHGYRCNVAITETVHHILIDANREVTYQSNLYDLLRTAKIALRRFAWTRSAAFDCPIHSSPWSFWAKLGQGDHMEPVITIMITGEEWFQ